MSELNLGALGMELVLGKQKWNQGFKDADKDVDTHHSKWKDFATNMGGKLAAGITAGVVGVGLAIGGMTVAGVNSALTLQDSMAKFQASTGKTAEETAKVKDIIKDLYKTNEDSYDSLAGTAEAMANNMGMSATEIEKYAQKYLNYAKVTKQGNEDVVGAIDDIGDAWGLTNDESVAAMDKMLVLQQDYGMAVGSSQGALQSLAPAAKAAGMSIDETMSYLAMFAQTGVDAEVASTGFTKALTQVKSPEELKKLMKDIQDCEDPMKRAQMASELFGAKAGPKMAQALSESTVDINTFIKQMDGAAGAVDKASSSYDKSFKVQLELMKKQFEGMFASFGEKLLPLLQKAMDWLESKMPQIEKFVSSAMDGVGKALEWLMDNIMPALEQGLDALFQMWQAIWPSIKGIFDAVWPGIQAALLLVINNVLPVLVQMINTLMPPFMQLIQMLLLPLVGIMNTVVPILMSVITSVLPVISALLDAILTPLNALIQAIMPPLLQIFKSLIEIVLPPFKKLLEMLLPPIMQIIDCFMEIVSALLPPLLELFGVLIDSILPPLIDIFMVLVDLVLKNVMTVFEAFKPVIDSLIGILRGVIQFISSVFKGDWKGAWDGIKGIFSGIWDAIKGIFTGVWNTISGIFSSVWDTISTPLMKVWDWIKNTFQQVGEFLSKPFRDGWDFIKGIFDKIVGFISGIKIEFPKIKMPHFTITWDTTGLAADIAKAIGMKGVPKLNVEWYDEGGVFYQPTVIGVGEKRPEFVGALDDLKEIFAGVLSEHGNAGVLVTGNKFIIRKESDIPAVAREILAQGERDNRAKGVK